MKVLKSYVRNCNRLEGCIVECYIAEEAIEFCTEYLSNVDAIGIPICPRIDHKIGTPLPRSFVMKVDPIVVTPPTRHRVSSEGSYFFFLHV